MTRLHCLATCYMPVDPEERPKKGRHQVVERYEDEEGGIYEVEEDRVDEFLATDNFAVVAG